MRLKLKHLKYIILAVLSFGTLTIFFQSLFVLKTLDIIKIPLQFKAEPSANQPDTNNIGNVPLSYLYSPEKTQKKYNNTCAIYPKLFDISFTNDHWQTQSTSNGTLQLFNAYLDKRLSGTSGSLVRIVGMIDRLTLDETTYYCQFWYENSAKPVIVATSGIYKPWGDTWGPNETVYTPYIFTCALADEKRVPDSVSLVETVCQNATNNLRVKYKHVKEKKDFVVCAKGLNFHYIDVSVKLVEWIELLFLVGADKINLYQFHVHPNVQRVLDYYQALDRVEITPISLVGPFSNNPILQELFLSEKHMERRLQEVIPFNDCLYKHLHQFNYIVPLDIDEIIIPSKGNTWKDIILKTKAQFPDFQLSSIMAWNVFFMDNMRPVDHEWFADIPEYMHMLQHVYRAKNYTNEGLYVKGFHSTDDVVGLHNHFALVCLGPQCVSCDIDVELAHLQHYRRYCPVELLASCQEFKKHVVMDTRVWNYKDALIRNVKKVLTDLNIVP